MQRARKRQRTVPVVVQTSTKRPIDKKLVNVVQTVSNAQQITSLITSTFPGTITGIRWSILFVGGASLNSGAWAIVRSKDGVAPSTMTLALGTLYQPEQEVIAFGRWGVEAITNSCGPAIMLIEGSTKSMRKLMGGDQIYFICTGGTASAGTVVNATIQFFDKT